MDERGRLITWQFCPVSYALLTGGSLRLVGNVNEMAFCWAEEDERPVPGWAGQLGQGVREEIAGTGEGTVIIPPLYWWSQCSTWEAHLLRAWLSSVSKGIQILGLPNAPWKFVHWVHPLESRMLNLPPSPSSTRVTCIVLEAQLFHRLTRGL